MKDKITLHERPSGHFYEEKNRLYPSVTTIIHQKKNEALANWKKNTPSWRTISAAACKIGADIHTQIEHVAMHKPIKVKHKMQVDTYLKWEKETGFHCVKTEMKVKSKTAKYAGSLDMLGTINGDLFIVDLKTSKKIYPEMLLQLSAYRFAFEEMNSLTNVNIGVLRIDKKKKLVEWVNYTESEYETGIAEFLELCKQWHEDHNVEVEFDKKFILED